MVVSWGEKQLDKLQRMTRDLTDAANDKLSGDVFMMILNIDGLTYTRSKRSTTLQTFNSSIELLMLPRNKYDLNYHGQSNLTTEELIRSFLDFVDSGDITYNALDGIELLEYRECNDTKCETPLRTVKAPPPTANAATTLVLQIAAKLLFGSYIIVRTMML